MTILIWIVIFFFLFVISHVLCARRKWMGVELSRLMALCLLWLVLYALAIVVFPETMISTGSPLVLSSLVFYVLLCLSYIVECNLIPYGSPSMKILEFVNRQAGKEASYGQLKEYLTGQKIVLTRLDDLVAGGYVSLDGGRYVLRPSGARIAWIMDAYRGLLRRPPGG